MDFWHCHKPDVRDDDGKENGKTGGYSRLGYAVAQEGIGLVDMMYFLLDKHDVQNLQEVSLHAFLWLPLAVYSSTDDLVLYEDSVFKNINYSLETLFHLSREIACKSSCQSNYGSKEGDGVRFLHSFNRYKDPRIMNSSSLQTMHLQSQQDILV